MHPLDLCPFGSMTSVEIARPEKSSMSPVVKGCKHFCDPVDEQADLGAQVTIARVEHVKLLPRSRPVFENNAQSAAREMGRRHELERLPDTDARQQRAQMSGTLVDGDFNLTVNRHLLVAFVEFKRKCSSRQRRKIAGDGVAWNAALGRCPR